MKAGAGRRWPSCYGHRERKARRAHECCECHGAIQPGETYHYHHGVWEGSGASYKVCADCEALRAECDRDAYECTPFEWLLESVSAVWVDAPELLLRLIEIKRRRGATITPWMATLEDTAKQQKAHRASGDLHARSL